MHWHIWWVGDIVNSKQHALSCLSQCHRFNIYSLWKKMLYFRSKHFLKTAFQLQTGVVPHTFIHQVAWDGSGVLNSSWKTWTTSIHLSGSESCQIPSVLASVLQKQLRQGNVWQCLSSLLAAKQLHLKYTLKLMTFSEAGYKLRLTCL